MSDQSKSPFSFGQPQSSGTSSAGLFGATSQAPSTGGLFGSGPNPPTTSGAGLFGSTTTSTAPTSTPFGGTKPAGQSSAFGGGGGGGSSAFGGANKPASGGFSFGGAPANNASGGGGGGGIFGQAQASSPQTASTAAPSNAFSGFSTPNKPADASAGQGQNSNMFGGGASTGNAFSLGSNATTASQITPTSKPTSSFYGNSTTPAGPPPSSNAPSGGAFSFGKPQDQAQNPFPKPNTSSSATPSMFSNLGQSSAPGMSGSAATASTGAPSIFDPASKPTSTTNIFGNTDKTQSTGNLFGGANRSPDKDATKSNPFGQPPTTASAAPSTGTSMFGSASTSSVFNLNKPSAPAASSGPTITSPKPSSGAFSFSTQPTASSGTSASASTAPTNSLFPSLGKPQETPSTNPPTSSAAPTSSLFNAPPLGSTQAKPQSPQKAPTTTGPAAQNLGASTAGPAPPAQSRLKNKSMDDIITRWASDLSKYQKEFQSQAVKVAFWDRMLIENSEKIQKLYGSTLEAERATTEVERQLTAVESDQAELEGWLDRYEREFDGMIAQQVGNEGGGGPDQERERTYQLASRLTERLDEMSRDLGSMIDEINDASSTLSKNTNPDDPLTQVIRTLNTHLTSLQTIDQNTAALTLKVKEAQKTSHRLEAAGRGGGIGPGSGTGEAADAFWRSYLGRR